MARVLAVLDAMPAAVQQEHQRQAVPHRLSNRALQLGAAELAAAAAMDREIL